MKTKLTLTLITLAGLIVFAGYISGGNSAAAALKLRPRMTRTIMRSASATNCR